MSMIESVARDPVGGRTTASLRWVALGDSFTAGIGCGEPTWPDLVELSLSDSDRRVSLLNLARVGATLEAIESTQVPAAIAAEPQLVTAVGGANDVIESVRPSSERIALKLDALFHRLRAALPGAAMLTATYPVVAPTALGPRSRRRVEEGIARLNETIRSAAAAWEVRCLELVDHPGQSDPANFAGDGLHPSAAGHRLAALTLAPSIEAMARATAAKEWT